MLINIDLSKVSFIEQIDKVREEDDEFLEAIAGYIMGRSTKEHIKEELCDKIQSSLGVAQKLGIQAEEIEEYLNTTHIRKMK